MAADEDRLTRVEMEVQHQRELMGRRDQEMDRRITDLQTWVMNLRSLLLRALTWAAGGLLLTVCSLIWKRLGF